MIKSVTNITRGRKVKRGGR